MWQIPTWSCQILVNRKNVSLHRTRKDQPGRSVFLSCFMVAISCHKPETNDIAKQPGANLACFSQGVAQMSCNVQIWPKNWIQDTCLQKHNYSIVENVWQTNLYHKIQVLWFEHRIVLFIVQLKQQQQQQQHVAHAFIVRRCQKCENTV